MRMELRRTRGSRYHPNCSTCGSTDASNAVAPPGGYTVCVRDMSAEADPHDIAPESQRTLSKEELSLKSFVTMMPVTAERK